MFSRPLSRRTVAIAASLLVVSLASIAAASSFDAVLVWFTSRELSQQVPWDRGTTTSQEVLLRQAYILGELANRVNRSTPEGRDLGQLGFREIATFTRRGKMEMVEAGIVIGATAGATGGLAVDIVTGGATGGLGVLVGGVVGGAKMRELPITSKATVAETLDGNMRVVAIQGSNDLPDVFVDMNAATVTDGNVSYHNGFFLYASVLYGEVVRQLADSCASGQNIWLTGHSLGGTAAQLIAFWLEREGCHVAGVMSFGSPMPGRDNLEARYNQLLGGVTHRFMHKQDPVACLPLGIDWAQVGRQHVFSTTTFAMDDNRDQCTSGGNGDAVGRASSFLEKLHLISDPSTELSVWIQTKVHAVGLCSDNRARRIILGILTLGASEVTCKSIDLTTNLTSMADQLSRLHHLALNDSLPLHHKMACSYLNRIEEVGFDRAEFGEGMWLNRFEQSWEYQDCTPPEPTIIPGQPALPVCCERRADGECALLRGENQYCP